MQAENEVMRGNWRAAVDLLLTSDQPRALEILIKQDQEEQVVSLMRRLNKGSHADSLKQCVKYFTAKKNHNAGKETLLKLGEQEELMKFHIELEKWDEAEALAKGDDSLRQIMLIPYAEWLSKKNRFDEASKYYNEAGRVDLALEILQKLSELSIVQERFREAGQFHWILSKESTKSIISFKAPSVDDKEKIMQYQNFLEKSYVYHAYFNVLSFLKTPISVEVFPGEHKIVFNSARYLLSCLKGPNLGRVILSLTRFP